MKCFKYHMQNKTNCEIKNCRYWICENKSKNCTLNFIEIENEKTTLEKIGDIFNVTRMRICQIEKNAIKKVKERISLTG